ncbi:MAG: hydroxyphenylacetyl-CoA thioesterase PaaI [bacterium]
MSGAAGGERSHELSAVVASMLERDAFTRWLGAEVVSVRPGHCVLRMRVRADMLNGFGVAHGGIAYSLADSAMAFACNSTGDISVAVDTSMSYPTAVRLDDDLVATAEEERATKRLGFYRVTVARADGTVVALFRGTVYRTDRQHDGARL